MIELLFIVLNSECTRACPFCFYNTGNQRKRKELINSADILRFTDFLKKKGLANAILSGGEPLLFDGLERLIKDLRNADIFTLLLTNGDLLTYEKKKELRKSGLSAISVSLHVESADEMELEKKITSAAEDMEIPLTFIFVLTSVNFTLAQKALHLTRKLGKGLIIQPAFIPSFNGKANEKARNLSIANLPPRDFDNLKNVLLEWGKSFNTLPYVKLLLSLYSNQPGRPKVCGMGGTSLVLNCDGEIIPCFHREDIVPGNILNDDYEKILEKNNRLSAELRHVGCFGEHCVSLFTEIR